MYIRYLIPKVHLTDTLHLIEKNKSTAFSHPCGDAQIWWNISVLFLSTLLYILLGTVSSTPPT